MQRRTFIQLLVGGAAATAVSAAMPKTVSSELRPLDEIDENYRALREKLRRIAIRDNAKITRFDLSPEDDGFRFVRVYVEGQERPLTFYQPWHDGKPTTSYVCDCEQVVYHLQAEGHYAAHHFQGRRFTYSLFRQHQQLHRKTG